MPNCPNCNTRVPVDAQYCPDCGESITSSCPECGTSIGSDAQFCPDCGTDLTSAQRGMSPGSEGSSSHLWRLAGDEFAKRLGGDAGSSDSLLERLRGRKTVRIEAGNRALLLEDGEVAETLEPGKHTLDSFADKIDRRGGSKRHVVVVIEESTVAAPLTFDDLMTADGSLVTVHVELTVQIDDRERFYRSMMGNKEVVTVGTLGRQFGDAIRGELETTLSSYDREELYGNQRLKQELQVGLETGIEELLARNGLELVDVVAFDYDDDRDALRERRQELQIGRETEALAEEEQELKQRAREREIEDHVHEARQASRAEAGEEVAEMSAEHEVEMQGDELDHESTMQDKKHRRAEIEKEHEIDDTKREHRHEAERNEVEHDEGIETHRTEAETERRSIEHEQDIQEMEDLVDLKKEKDRHSLDVEQRESDIEMREQEHDVEMERERLQARDEVGVETLVSLSETDEGMDELAQMVKAGELDLSPEQLDALGARESDELAKARQEAQNAEHERKRLDDQEAFREELREMAEVSLDRVQETSNKAMDSMGGAAEAAAEDTSDNVIVSGSGDGGTNGDTTIVQGGGGSAGDGGDAGDTEPTKVVVCPECDAEEPVDNAFCTGCGSELG